MRDQTLANESFWRGELSIHTAVLPVAALRTCVYDEPKFLELCRACGGFGKRWSCPPYDASPMLQLEKFKWVGLAGLKAIPTQAERDFAQGDRDKLKDQSNIMFERLRGPWDATLLECERHCAHSRCLLAGACLGCAREDCTRLAGRPCRFPEKMRWSLESCGCDVAYASAQFLGVPLRWMQGALPPYFFLVGALFFDTLADDFSSVVNVQWQRARLQESLG